MGLKGGRNEGGERKRREGVQVEGGREIWGEGGRVGMGGGRGKEGEVREGWREGGRVWGGGVGMGGRRDEEGEERVEGGRDSG